MKNRYPHKKFIFKYIIAFAKYIYRSLASHLIKPFSFYVLQSIFCILQFTFFAFHSFPAIITVKQDSTGNYIKIQNAINAAEINDTVLVWPGIYYENLHIASKPITLASLYLTTGDKQSIYQTIIDGSTIKNSVIVADNFPVGSMGTICGFTIQHGDARYNEINYTSIYFGMGGGILMYYANLNIIGCLIQNNLAQVFGGGIKVHHSDLIISGSTIRYNLAYLGGGGLWFYGGDNLVFDTNDLNNLYFNQSIMGNDFLKHFSLPMPVIKVDTATTMNDYGYNIMNANSQGAPVYDLQLIANHAMIDQVDADVYVSTSGDNSNSGLTPDEPLQNIWYAMTKINPDTNNRRTVHVLPGTYSPSVTGEIYPINARSNSALVGQDMNSCILDAEQTWFHYSAHSRSYSLTLKNLKFINGNSFINENRTDAGSIQLDWSCYNITLQNIFIENCIGLDAGGAQINTLDWISLENVHVKSNFGGVALRPFYTAQQIKTAVKAINCSAINNLPYQNGYGSGGGIGITNTYTTIMPLISSISGLVVCENKCRDWWGGLQFLNPFNIGAGKSIVSNVTVAENENDNHLPGAYATWEKMKSYVYNSIFYNNEHPSIILGVEPPLETPGELFLDYSLIEQGLDDIWNQLNYNILHYGVNNIEGNPLFVGSGQHPYQLKAGSPCINTGTPMYESGMEPPYIKLENGQYILYTHDMDTIHLPATDLAGNPRIAYGRIDMGAYEFPDTTVGIKKTVPNYTVGSFKAIPNPFQHSTSIEATLLKEGNYKVIITDMNGRHVKTLLDAFTQPGNYNMRWHADDDNGHKIPSGYYIVNIFYEGENVESLKVRRW